MIREGETGPTAPYSWRLRLPLGLFALAVLGVLVDASNTSNGALGAVAVVRHHRGGVVLLFSGGVAVLVALALLVALATRALRRRAPRARVEPLAPAPARGRLGVPPLERVPGPGPAHELLALFARPRPEPVGIAELPNVPSGQEGDEEAGRALEHVRVGPAAMIRLYGPLAIEPGEPLCLRDRSVRGLLACLAIRRGPVGFSELTELLWPGEDFAKARTRLYKAKQLARDALGEGLERQRAGYLLDLTKVTVDVLEIERIDPARAGPELLERALELSRGEPLADVDYPFAESERRRLGSIRVDLLVRVARARLEAGEARASLEAAEELIALDVLNELGWRLAMEAEASLGTRRAIIERYAMLAGELDRALGLRPHAETRATYRRLLGQA